MKIFSRLFGFLKDLFAKARPGMDDFIKYNLEYGKSLVSDHWEEIADRGFHLVKQKLFHIAQQRFPVIAGTWLSVLLDFAYEHTKAAIQKSVEEQLR